MVVISIKLSDGSVIRSRSENGSCSRNGASVVPVKWKPRNVSAVRDFPEGCGPVVRPINVVPHEPEPLSSPVADNHVASDDVTDEHVGLVVKSLMNNELRNGQEPLSSLVANNHVASDDVTDERVGLFVESLMNNVLRNGPEPLSSPVANNHVVSDDVTDERVGLVVESLNNELRNGDVQVDNGGSEFKQAKRRMKFTPRKVSAIRDFPDYCGLDADEPTEEERIRITGRRSCDTESNGGVKGKSVDKTQSSESNKYCMTNQEMQKIMESNIDVEDAKMMKFEPSKKVQNIGQACQELVVYTREKDLKNASPVDDAHDVDYEEDDEDNTPLSIIQKDMSLKNREVGSKRLVKKRPLDDTHSPVYKGEKLKVVMGLKAPSFCVSEVQEKDSIKKAKGHTSTTPKQSVIKKQRNQEKVVGESTSSGEVAYTSTIEMVENDSTNKKKEDASATPKTSMKKKQKNQKHVGTLEMVVRNEEDFVADMEEKEEGFLNSQGTPTTPKTSMKKKQKNKKHVGTLDMVVRSEEDFVADMEEKEGSLNSQGTDDVDVTLPPFGPRSSNDARNKVRETLRLFQTLCRKLLQGEEARTDDLPKKRIDLAAKAIMGKKGRLPVLGKKTHGPVPGVEVGDEFMYRVELALVGIHRPFQGGIDYVKMGKDFFAVSVVASGGYANEVDKPDCLMYSGSGGIAKDKSYENQKLERGNLALSNNVERKYPVRVVRGYEVKSAEPSDSKPKSSKVYVYDGLYTVESCKNVTGPKGNMVYKFELKRVPGQPLLAIREVKSKKYKTREGVCVKDITNGKEVFPICAINTIDDEKPPEFTYITKIMYPDWYKSVPPKGCDCVGRCSDKRCSCALKNGGEIPYNRNGAIVEAKPLVYECGPSCGCPPTCYNRVTQRGMKIHLEIFKTESRGWGVRSLSSISSGSFICEYIGEFLEETEAEKRTGNDEYLFDIGQNYNDCSLNPDAKPEEIVNTSGGFTIDAANFGNVGRFINHSCSPNLYAQNVLFDMDDKRMPHIMLFAAENISPLQELTYHYNYAVDTVEDADGNIKVKSCYCGSSECTGRLY